MSKSGRDQKDGPMDRSRTSKRNQQHSAEVNRNEEMITSNSQNSGRDQWKEAERREDPNQLASRKPIGSDKRDRNVRREEGDLRHSSRTTNYTGNSERTGQQYSDPKTESNPEAKDIRDQQRFYSMDPAEGSE